MAKPKTLGKLESRLRNTMTWMALQIEAGKFRDGPGAECFHPRIFDMALRMELAKDGVCLKRDKQNYNPIENTERETTG